ncbi:MAG: HD-GYP domain-containing protein [Treponema sp.]|nr:HD-GYP domain-containing protein [Candidatus Treponema merdequi]
MEFISREIVYFINAIVDSFICIVLAGVFLHTCLKLEQSKEKKVFLILLFCAIIYNVGDLANWVFEGTDKAYKIPLLHILTFLLFISGPMIYIIFMKLVRTSFKNRLQTNLYYYLCLFFSFVAIVMGFLSCYPGLLYIIDSNNIYKRSQYHVLVSIVTFLYYLFSILYILSCKEQLSKKEFWYLFLFPTIPVFSYIPQFFLPGITTLNVGILISIIVVYKCVLLKIKLDNVNGNKAFTSEFFVKQKVSLSEKITRIIFRYGYSEGAWDNVKHELSENISYTLKLLSASVCVMTLFLFFLSYINLSFAHLRNLYVITFLLSSILFLILFAFKNNDLISFFLSFTYLVTIYILNIYKYLILSPQQLPLLFCCVLFIVPSIFCNMPYVIYLLNYGAVFIYLDLAQIYKPEQIQLDSVYLFFITTLGIIIGYGISKTKIKSLYLSKNLDKEISAKTKQLNGISNQIVKTMVYSIETKDENIKGHAERVAEYAVKIAHRLKWNDQRCTELWLSAILHDVGKIGIPDEILKKETVYDDREYEIVKTHTELGEKILQNLTYYPKARIVARSHHERFDGNGYPDGLAGKNIPIEARIVAIADAYEAMSSTRAHRQRLEQKKIIQELIYGMSKQFDPELVNIMLHILEEEREY